MPDDIAPRELVTRLFHDVLNARALELLEELFAPSARAVVEELLEAHAAFLTAIPDLEFTVRDVISEENKIAVRWTAHGTHLGDFAGIPGTGTRVALRGIDIFRIQNGAIAEHWSEMDQLGLLARLANVEVRRQAAVLRA